MLMEDLTGKILEERFEVANELGHGFLESDWIQEAALSDQRAKTIIPSWVSSASCFVFHPLEGLGVHISTES